jgi:hypothetical protein
MSASAAQTNTSTETSGPTGHTSTGRGGGRGGRGGHRHQSQRVVASASVPITTELIGAVVGKQGATINKIKEATYTRISHLEPTPGDGHLFHSFHISGSPQGVDRARKWVLSIIANTYRADHPDEFQTEEPAPDGDASGN